MVTRMTGALRVACLVGSMVECGAEPARVFSLQVGAERAAIVQEWPEGFPAPGGHCESAASA